ncbi:EAL domain-containing protein [Alteriqipengyuania flavescens]|uniref:putative bifunctional diguanylate cyclase/phosphodiesterase n=1 Tax=Alteriqipengyuania flavescens TaxID=3053610 RepID=UPI0025B307DF|nr:EAL domain-containing protein [Alteriqipengyuania flavescens]WJY20075.1 EAL domain-containing protein [Alteriqipengyuania flavescens]WJY26018.1 EAL domain-containing protein [Alteriqipengyuania flavescens]
MGKSRFFSKRDSRASATDRSSLLEELEALGLGCFWASNAEGLLTYISPSATAEHGIEASDLTGQQLLKIFADEPKVALEPGARPLSFVLGAHTAIRNLTVRLTQAPAETWWSISALPQIDSAGNFAGYRGTARDVTAIRHSSADRDHMARYDALTGLSNRARMAQRLQATITAVKAAKRSCALMLLDLDRFKQVNDTLGHPYGDKLLKQVAQRLQKIVGDKGEIGRIGGDEFQIILPDMDDRGELGALASRLIQMVSQPYSIEGSRAIIGTSVGIAIAPYDGVEAEELVGGADLALYAAKGKGRGQYRFYSQELREEARWRREIEEDLRDAVSKQQLRMVYQPLVRSSDYHVAGFEALMRWDHPVRGEVGPGTFIPVAEETGLILEIGAFALREACRQAAEWPGDLKLAINVSVPQFVNAEFVEQVAQALSDSGLPAQRLEIEITESVFMGDHETVIDRIGALTKMGVRLALDDFGTGYSSFGYLRNAPFNKIKIDQSFVRGATENDNNNAAIVTAIVSLASALKMETVAEGVETMDELELVVSHGATLIQGYLFARPETHEAVMERLNHGELTYQPVGPAKYRADRQSMFRRVGIIHGDHLYGAMLRNLSKSGAWVEGIAGTNEGMQIVLDLGEGQLAVGTVRRAGETGFGMEFETALVSDGADGLCTRHRISPYALANAGMPLAALPNGSYPLNPAAGAGGPTGPRELMEVVARQRGAA